MDRAYTGGDLVGYEFDEAAGRREPLREAAPAHE
jgi:hypothetical protein